jgi:hypothetical protein
MIVTTLHRLLDCSRLDWISDDAREAFTAAAYQQPLLMCNVFDEVVTLVLMLSLCSGAQYSDYVQAVHVACKARYHQVIYRMLLYIATPNLCCYKHAHLCKVQFNMHHNKKCLCSQETSCSVYVDVIFRE